MRKIQKAFTLIELIFVIIILGILSTVAIPKLMASRDDTKMVVSLTEMGMIVSEVSSYYTTVGSYSSNVSDMTSVKNLTYPNGWNGIVGEGTLVYSISDVNNNLEDCVEISLKNREGNLTVSNILGVNTSVCLGLQNHFMYQKLLGTKLVGGNRIKF